jgi:hypothetical protein
VHASKKLYVWKITNDGRIIRLGICIFAAFIVIGKTTGFAEPLNSIKKEFVRRLRL